MVYALILSGGKGVRLGNDRPKQYLEIGNKPIIGYSLDAFQKHSGIDGIVIVADSLWQDYISAYVENNSIDKFVLFAPAGQSRTHSILNGLKIMKEYGMDDDSIVIVHDAARPNVTDEIIDNCINLMTEFDCVMPVIPVKDTVYMSEDKKTISSLLNRSTLWAGQAPESVRLGQYLSIIQNMTDDELCSISGTSAVVYEKGFNVGLFDGDEANYKITTVSDLEKFRREIEG